MMSETDSTRTLYAISWMSFLWSTASLMAFSILPLFLTETLHVSHGTLGLMEGLAIGFAFFAKVYSGIASDMFRRRKPFILAGSIMCVFTKPLFACASSASLVFLTRFLDRVSKGIRSAPTDALVADISTKETHGRAYGVRQALYTAGAVFGAAMTAGMLHWMPHGYRTVFWAASIPAAAAVVVCLWIREPLLPKFSRAPKWQRGALGQFSPAFWLLLLVCFFLMLARFSEAFVTLRAKQTGWAVVWLPFTIILMDTTHAGFAYFIGRFVPAHRQKSLLMVSFIVFIGTDLVFFWAQEWKLLGIGIFLNGVHMGLSQGTLRTLVAMETPAHLHGTAFSLFHGVCGVAVLLGNVIAGRVSDHFGLPWTFLFGGGFVCIAMGLLIWHKDPKAQAIT
jgi:MFS family permease